MNNLNEYLEYSNRESEEFKITMLSLAVYWAYIILSAAPGLGPAKYAGFYTILTIISLIMTIKITLFSTT